jgi:DNA-binding transcriptional MerR regulator
MEARVAANQGYTVRRLASIAGVSVRTLHHYDAIGLLKPTTRSAAGYRLYGEADLLRLQQILFYKELDLPLGAIRDLLEDPGFDPVAALRSHRRALEQQVERLTRLLNTVDKTIAKLKETDMELTDEELYEGFSKEQIERYEREARERWDPQLVAQTQKRVRSMSREQWNAVKREGDEVTRRLAELMGRAASDPDVQQAIGRHHAWIEHFYPAPAALYRGLGEGYAEHPDFRAFYEKYRPGLADFMKEAMAYYAKHTLGG